jgi:hypothetical protein
LITSYENIWNHADGEPPDDGETTKKAAFWSKVTFAVNIVSIKVCLSELTIYVKNLIWKHAGQLLWEAVKIIIHTCSVAVDNIHSSTDGLAHRLTQLILAYIQSYYSNQSMLCIILMLYV